MRWAKNYEDGSFSYAHICECPPQKNCDDVIEGDLTSLTSGWELSGSDTGLSRGRSQYHYGRRSGISQEQLNSFSAGIDLRRQNLTSKVDTRTERIKCL